MHQIDNSSAVTNMPALGPVGTPGWFTPGDPGGAQDSTIVDSDWANAVQAEILAVLAAGGVTWDKTKLNQMATAIQTMIATASPTVTSLNANYQIVATDGGKTFASGSPNLTATMPALADVPDGFEVGFQCQNPVFNYAASGTEKLYAPGLWGVSAAALYSQGEAVRFKKEGATGWLAVATAVASDAGKVGYFPLSSPPAGWLACNGAAVSRTTYARLYAAIGGLFGNGDGATTFNLPDFRGEFLRGWDNGRGVDSGRGLGTWQGDAFASHQHNVTGYGASSTASGSGLASASGGNGNSYTNTNLISATGGTETRPRNYALLPCIKY